MVTTTHWKTYADLRRMPDDGRRYELIGGEIVVSPAPNLAHQEVLKRLVRLVLPFETVHQIGILFFAPVDVRISPADIVQPDLLFVRKGRESILGADAIVGAPDLVVEILSPSTRSRDEGEKLALYAAAGVAEYWIADIENRSFRALTLKNGRYEPIPRTGRFVRSIVLSGLEIDVEALFADLS